MKMTLIWQQFALRVAIVLFWLTALYLFLSIPYYIQQVTEQRSINLLAWPTGLDSTFFAEFEQETGIKVNISYFQDNEQLFVKLQSGQGYGYDLIMPADYGADLLRREGLLKKIDRSKLPFMNSMFPQLFGHFFDPQGEYTIPYSWAVFGLGIDKRYYQKRGATPVASWDLIFNPTYAPTRVGMPDDARELAYIAAYYLFKKTSDFNMKQLNDLQRLLIEQKKWVVMYTDMRADYLLISQTAPVVLALSAEIARALREYSYLDFLIPQEGTFIVIDTLAIPVSTKKDDLVYTFLNYLYRPDVMQKYVNRFGFYPVLNSVKPADERHVWAIPTEDFFQKLQFFNNSLSERFLNTLWINLKA